MSGPRRIVSVVYGQNAASSSLLLPRFFNTRLSPVVMLFHMLCSISLSSSLSSHSLSSKPASAEFMERASTNTYKFGRAITCHKTRQKTGQKNYISMSTPDNTSWYSQSYKSKWLLIQMALDCLQFQEAYNAENVSIKMQNINVHFGIYKSKMIFNKTLNN